MQQETRQESIRKEQVIRLESMEEKLQGTRKESIPQKEQGTRQESIQGKRRISRACWKVARNKARKY